MTANDPASLSYRFRQDALASWVTYKETGRHLTNEEVRRWLNTWGTDAERAVPDCHE